MRVLLVTPENRFIRAFRRGQLNNFAQLTTAHLAGFVRPPHTVALVDEYVQGVDLEAPADLVGITCNTPNADHVYGLAAAFRARGRIGRAGRAAPDPAAGRGAPSRRRPRHRRGGDHLAAAARRRRSRRSRAGVSRRRAALPARPAAAAPRPDRRPRPGRQHRLRDPRLPASLQLLQPAPIYAPALRFRPAEEVVAEIKGLRSPLFAFWDDQLFMDRGYALRLFAALEGLRRRWAAMVTLASARDERLLAAAARAGCVCLFLGLESFSPRSLELANKSFNVVESYAEAVARIHAHGIAVQAGIVFGFDGDDEATFEKTLVEATRLGLDGATVSILTPFPGTPLFEELQRTGRLLTRDWSYYNGKTAVAFRPARMTPEALWNGYMWFRRQFFSRRCVRERLRRSRVRPLQSLALNWGYGRAIENALPGWPIPGGERSEALDWPGRAASVERGPGRATCPGVAPSAGRSRPAR